MNIYSKIAMLPLLTIFAACQSNEAPIQDNTASEGAQVISLRVANAKSRAGRPLESTEPGQSIENVKIILVDENDNVVWTRLLDKWSTIDATACDGGRETTIEIPKEEYRMVAGKGYHAYAIGYSETSDYDLSAVTSAKVNDKFDGDIKIKTLNASPVAEEIFAGDCLAIGNIEGVRIHISLNRQVAGTYGYMTRIPYVTDRWGNVGTYLMLCGANTKSEMTLGKYDNQDNASQYNGLYVANGSNSSDNNVIYTINLKDWFGVLTEQRDENNHSTGLILVDNNWRGDKSRYRVGSVFAGEFIIPFTKTEDTTLKLYLCTAQDITTAVRTWDVLLPEDAPQNGTYNLWKYDAAGWTEASVTDDTRCYNVLRNHLYGIGVKNSAVLPGWDPQYPDDPVPPSDDDDPEPINNKQELPITVNHNWSAILNMEVE